jgi:hypothetical protein
MTSLFAILIPIALINSLSSLPPKMAGVIAALGTRQPYLTGIAFIAGVFVPFFLFGLLLAIGLDSAFDRLKTTVMGAWQDPSIILIFVQLFIGTTIMALVFRLVRKLDRPATPHAPLQMSPVRVFSLAAGATVLGLPTAIFYFAAIDQVLRADLNALQIVKAILFYNVVYLLPLVLVVLVRRLFGPRADPLFDALRRFFERWGKTMLAVAVSGLGIVLVADAVSWLAGLPLLPIRIR